MARECVRCGNTEKEVRRDKLKCGAWWQARKRHLYIDVDNSYKTKHKEKDKWEEQVNKLKGIFGID